MPLSEADGGGGLLNLEGSLRAEVLWLRVILEVEVGQFLRRCSIWVEGLSAGLSRLCWLESRSMTLLRRSSISAALTFLELLI